MKKLSLLFSVFILLTAFTCENEPLDGDFYTGSNQSCEQAMMNTALATQNYISAIQENYEENFAAACLELKIALEAQLQLCGDDSEGNLQATINSMLCSTDPDECEVATSGVVIAEQIYNNATEEEFENTCILYREALQNKITECGDADGSIQGIIDGLGDCSDDTNEPTDIVGTWLMTAWMGEEPIDLNNDGVESLNFLDEMDCYNNETLVFNANNTVVATSNAYADFEFSIVAGTTNTYEYTITCINEVDITNGTWTQNGNTVSISEGTESSIWTLNGNQLSILVPSGFIAYSSEDSEVTTIQDITFIYTKQ